MKKVVTYLLGLSFIVLLASTAYAGGIDNKQNLSAKYISTGSRNAATSGTDIVTYNPAGTTRVDNGLYLQLDTQYILKDYTHEIGGMDFDQDEPSILPTFFALYKKDRWATFASFTISGGGGKVDYESGNIITFPIAALVGATAQSIMAESLYYTYTLGGAYAVSDKVSLALGGRYINATKEIDATATETPTSVIINYDQEATGFGWIAGVNFAPTDTMNLALRYESEVDLDFETDYLAASNDLGKVILATQMGNKNGSIHSRNLPALLGAGAEWKATDTLTVSTSFTLYLEKNVDWDGHENDVEHNAYDLGITLENAFTPKFIASVGYMYTDVGIDPANFDLVEMMSPALDNHAIMVGGEYKYSDRLTLTSGIMCNYYVGDDAPAVTGKRPAVGYEKTNYVFAMGFEYKFL